MSWEIILLYFFSWNLIWFLQKEPMKVQYFRLLTAHVKFHQIFTLIGSFCWKYIKFQVKTYRGVIYISWYWRVVQNLKKNQFVVSKMARIWWMLIWALKSLKNLIGPFHAKCIAFDLKRKKTLLVVWKMTRRIWQIFIRTLLKRQNWHFHGVILSKVQNAWAKNLQMSYV